MGRKNLLAGLLDDELTAVNSGSGTAGSIPDGFPTLGSRGAVGAMSRSLDQLSAEIEAARSLGTQIASGLTVVDLDPGLVDASFVPDRMSASDLDQASLVEAIRQHGQQVPILVRPHPEVPGRYETAYGHRRLRAAAALKRPVRAIVRELSDNELVVAQGQENSARKDLSYIERAMFAGTLEQRGFARDTIMAALTVDKTELSRFLAVSRAVPKHLIDAIGSAPKAGRRRWLDLAGRVESRGAEKIVSQVIQDPAFLQAASDERIALVLDALTQKKPASSRATISRDDSGRRIARVQRSGRRLALVVEEAVEPDFAGYIVDRLPEMYRSFRQERVGEMTITPALLPVCSGEGHSGASRTSYGLIEE
jgi:ParB family transcriptional regulator, chromosome partitioning protein